MRQTDSNGTVSANKFQGIAGDIVNKILIADDDVDLRDMLRLAVQSQGYIPIEASNAKEAIELFEVHGPGIVISDYAMPGGDGLELLRAIRSQRADTIVIMLTGCGKEEVAAEAMRLRANNYLTKPIRMEELLSLLHKYSRILEERTIEEEILGMILRREFTMQFANRVDIVSKIADQLVRETGTRIDAHSRYSVHLGLYEILINAIEHGNLGITFEEKSRALESSERPLAQLYEERLADPKLADRKVTVEFKMDHEKCEWIIEDEGEGFDWSRTAEQMSEGLSETLNGRGIFLAKFQFDEIEYMGRGNRVRLVKKLTGAGLLASLDEISVGDEI